MCIRDRFLFRAFLPIAPITASAPATRVIQGLLEIDAIFNSWFIFSPAVLAIWHKTTIITKSAIFITLAFVTDCGVKGPQFRGALFTSDKKQSQHADKQIS